MASNNTTACTPMAATSNGVFQGDNPLDFSLDLLILQILLVVIFTRTLAYFLKKIRQPRVIAEIIGGILLGPSALGRNSTYMNAVFPSDSLTVLNTIANIGLLFFLFLVGVEIDPKSLRKTGKKALAIAAAGISVPFALGIGSSMVFRQTISKGVAAAPFLVFMGVALSITADKPWRPLSRVIPMPPGIISPYRLLILIRFVVLCFFLAWRIKHPNEEAIWLWLMSVVCEVWFGFSWLLDQLPKLNPVNRSTDLAVLRDKFDMPTPFNPTRRSDLPGVDLFVSTADLEKEPPLVTANTILSILAVDYPVEKLSCYIY